MVQGSQAREGLGIGARANAERSTIGGLEDNNGGDDFGAGGTHSSAFGDSDGEQAGTTSINTGDVSMTRGSLGKIPEEYCATCGGRIAFAGKFIIKSTFKFSHLCGDLDLDLDLDLDFDRFPLRFPLRVLPIPIVNSEFIKTSKQQQGTT